MKPNDKYTRQIRKMRKAAGLTQNELGKLTGIPAGTIAYYESGGGIRVEVYDAIIEACSRKIADNQKLIAINPE